ncbi:MAG TPA: glycosyltransferase family 2 protein [Chloroflexia bacterium]|nr:glycosyltransferase family 2 protein [Chloroflexia bacterium]
MLDFSNQVGTLPQANSSSQEKNQSQAEPLHAPVVIAIPAYNEERFVGSVVIQALNYTSCVLVVDDGSQDATAAIASKAGAIVISHPANQGKAHAVNTAMEWARRNSAQAIVFIDGDGQHKPSEIDTVLAPVLSGEADIVIGSRFLSIKSKIPFYRRLGQHALTAVTNMATSTTVTDSQSGFRAFSRRAIEDLHFSGNGFSVESEMQMLVKVHKLRLCEVPVSVIYQEKAKRNPVNHGLQIVSNIVRLAGQHRPLLFFSVTGLLFLVPGIIWSLIIVDIYARSRQLAIGYALIDVILIILGILSVFVGLILHSIRAFFLDLKKTVLRSTNPLPFYSQKDEEQ